MDCSLPGSSVLGISQARILGTSQVVLVVKNQSADAGDIRDVGSVSESGRSPEGGLSSPFQYYCSENLMDRGAWKTTVHGIAKNWTG